jgi:opacity protein-like surface antigen
MKRFLLAAAVLTASLSGPASAADLPGLARMQFMGRPWHSTIGPDAMSAAMAGGSGLGESGPIQCSGAEVLETRPRAVD